MSASAKPRPLIDAVKIAFCAILILTYPIGFQPYVQVVEQRFLSIFANALSLGEVRGRARRKQWR